MNIGTDIINTAPAGTIIPFEADRTCEASNEIPHKQIKITKPKPIKNTENIGRNDPCWCGSGQKFKRCHGIDN